MPLEPPQNLLPQKYPGTAQLRASSQLDHLCRIANSRGCLWRQKIGEPDGFPRHSGTLAQPHNTLPPCGLANHRIERATNHQYRDLHFALLTATDYLPAETSRPPPV